MKINEAARLAGVSERTLRYYDRIGLLRPSAMTDSGYRLYDEDALRRLQQILFFRELGFPLAQIGEIMDSPGYDKDDALRRHRLLLIAERDRLSGLIDLAERTLKGESDMCFDAFDRSEIDRQRDAYAEEARERWGGTDAYAEVAFFRYVCGIVAVPIYIVFQHPAAFRCRLRRCCERNCRNCDGQTRFQK